MPSISSLECSRCHRCFSAASAPTVCSICGSFLFVRYDMEELNRSAKRPAADDFGAGMRRYADVLPDFAPISLGEGGTPLLASRRFPGFFVKDERRNPMGSFEDRGMALAVAAAQNYGIQQLSIMSTGEAAASMAAYAAVAGIGSRVDFSHDVVQNHSGCVSLGAKVSLVNGLVGGLEQMTTERAGSSFDLSELKEPFRMEGMKTLGYELVEQMGWKYPVAVFCPIGIGVLAIWKAFEEMEQLGWVTGRRPRVFVVSGDSNSFGMDVVEKSGGAVIAGGDVLASLLDWGREEGFLLSPDGAAGVGAYQALLASRELCAEDRVVLINGSAGEKSAEAAAKVLHPRPSLPSSLPVGGIITPQ